MICVFPYSPKDQDLAAKLSAWIAELGKNTGHKALICRDARTNPNIDREVRFNLEQVFDSVDTVNVVERMDSDWSAESNTSAMAANIMFRTAAKHIQFTDPQPFLWLEPDVVILKKGWVDEVAKAYAEEPPKPFMGDFVNFPGVPPHMSGIAVYPAVVVNHAPLATMAGGQDTAWDVYASDQIVPQMKQTHLIKHQWKFKGVGSESEFQNFMAQCGDAVIFHQDKTGTVLDYLRRGHKGTDSCQSLDHQLVRADSISAAPATSTLPAQQNDSTGIGRPLEGLSCDLFTKSYPHDYPWLAYCCRSTALFASGFRKHHIVIPQSNEDYRRAISTSKLEVVTHEVPEYGNDAYLSQQIFKMYADTFTDADYITHLDSDTIFTRPVTPETYLRDGKPIWMYSPIDKVHPNQSHAWREVMQKFMGQTPDFEFMRRFPFMVPRWAYQAFRDFCKQKHGVELKDYVMAQPYRKFSEFNCLGFFLYEYHYDKFHWVNTSVPESEWPVLTVDQEWSYNEIPVERWEKILSSGCNVYSTEAGGSNPQRGNMDDVTVNEEPSRKTSAAQTTLGVENGALPSLDSSEARDGVGHAAPISPSLSDEIRYHVSRLHALVEGKQGRKQMVLSKLRELGLAPKAKKR